MQLSVLQTIAAALMAASTVVASPIEHVHHQHEKRDVKVVTRTTLVTVYGNNAAAPPTTTTSFNPEATSYSTTTSAIEPVTTLDTSSVSFSKTTSVGALTTSSASASASASSSSDDDDDSSSFNGGAKGVTYSPYTASGSCKTASEVADDLASLTGFEIIRIYGVDCDQVSTVLQAKTSSQKLFLGIYDVSNIDSAVETISSAVESYGSWDDIYTVSVGNELVNNGEATVSQVLGYVESAKSLLTSAGYSGPVVSVDTFIAVINNPGLCTVSDYVAVNAHAYFDGGIVAEDAGEWVLEQIQRVWTACGGKQDVLITETGWPSQGETYGSAVPSKANQKAAISGIKEKCGNDAILYTAFNDYWKADGSYGVEKYWGFLSDN